MPGMDAIHDIFTDVSISDEDFHLIRDGRGTIYVFGEMNYRDIFRARHYTKFCLRSTGPTVLGSGYLEFCESGNDGD